MTDNTNPSPHDKSFTYNPDVPLMQSSGRTGDVYAVTAVGVGQAIGTGDSEDAEPFWVVVVTSENVNGDQVVTMLQDVDLEMIRRADDMRQDGFGLGPGLS